MKEPQSYALVVGCWPKRTYKSTSPVPPLVWMFRFVAPEGTATEKYCKEPVAPEMFVCSKGVTVFPPPLVLKLAVMLALLVPAAMVQLLLVPLQAPLQPAKVLPLAAWAVRVMAVVLAKLADALVQPAVQLKPLGLLVTLPAPVPDLVSVTKRVVAAAVKLAVTLRALSMLTVQLLVPLQAPPQPVKLLPDAGYATKVTDVPAT